MPEIGEGRMPAIPPMRAGLRRRFSRDMKTELLIVADRAHMKVYTVEKPGGRARMPHLVEDFIVDEVHDRYADQYTDQAGSFPNAGTLGQGNSIAERMSLEAENETRFFRKLATHLEEVVRTHQPERWSFAAPSEINGAILDGVPSDCRKTLVQNVPKDLVNQPVTGLLAHFQKA